MTNNSPKMIKRLPQRFFFKHNEEMIEILALHPILLKILFEFNAWIYMQNLRHRTDIPEITVTRVIDEKIPGFSVSDTHSEGRAIDLRSHGWDMTQIAKALDYINTKFYEYGAYKNGERRVLVYHKGTAWHWHMQVRADINNFLKGENDE